MGDFLTRFLAVSTAMDLATRPSASASPPSIGALDDARSAMIELRGEARQLIALLDEDTSAASCRPRAVMPVLNHGRRPSWWQDAEVALFVTQLHRQVEIRQAVKICQERFGIERAPSSSSLHRYWMKLDRLARESRR